MHHKNKTRTKSQAARNLPLNGGLTDQAQAYRDLPRVTVGNTGKPSLNRPAAAFFRKVGDTDEL
jgi:hypothetical protein